MKIMRAQCVHVQEKIGEFDGFQLTTRGRLANLTTRGELQP